MTSQQVVFKDRDNAAFFYGDTAALSIYGVISATRHEYRIAPVSLINGAIGLDTDAAFTVLSGEVEFI